MTKPSAKPWGFLIRLVISLAALAGLIYFLRDKLGEAFLLVRQGLRWDWFIWAVAVYVLSILCLSWRFQLVLRVQGVRVSFWEALYLTFLGFFFNLFFPSSFGGDVAKTYFAYQYSGKKLASFTGVILDRLLGFGTIVLIALVALVGYSRSLVNPTIERTVYGALGLLVMGTIFFSSHRFARKFQFLSFLIPSAEWRENLSNFYHAIREFKHHKKMLISCLAISVAAQFLAFVNNYLIARSLGVHVSLLTFLLLGPLVIFISLAPSLSGLGVREAGFVFFFKSFMTTHEAFALALLFDALLYGSSLLGGLVFAFKGGLKKRIIHDLEEVKKLQEVHPV